MIGRNKRGRFVAGHPYAALGWAGLVAKRFDGDHIAARAWLAQLGRHAYAKQAIGGTRFEYRLQTIWPHPGPPDQFLAEWRRRLAFTLADVEELRF